VLAAADDLDIAMADNTAAPLPDDPRPATSPFTGFALGLLVLIGLFGLATGFAVRRGLVDRLQAGA
jgi:hypothetical protein